MFRTIIISSLILLFALLFYIFSPTIFGLYLFIAIIILLSSLLLSVYSAKKHVHYILNAPSVTTKNEKHSWSIQCTNNSKWFTANAKMAVTWEHTFTKQRYSELVVLTIPARKTVTVAVAPAQLYSGHYSIQIGKIIVSDALLLFSAQPKTVYMQSTVVLPNASFSQHTSSHDKNTAQLPNATSFAQLNGDELAHLKLYRPGDSVKQIHWKLSSKLDELYITQLETTTGQQFMLAVDAAQLDANIALYDQLIEITANQLFSSVMNGRYGQFAFYYKDWQIDAITNEAEVKSALQKLLLQTTLVVPANAWQQLLQRYSNALLFTANAARQHETNAVVIQQRKEGLTDEMDQK